MGLNFENLFKRVWEDKQSRDNILKIYFTQEEIESFHIEELKLFLKDILIENLINKATQEELEQMDLDITIKGSQSEENIANEVVEYVEDIKDVEDIENTEKKDEDMEIVHHNLMTNIAADDSHETDDFDTLSSDIDEIPFEVGIVDEDAEPKKLAFLGPPNAGKTSIIRTFFYGHNPKDICKSSIEPTKNYESGTVKWSLLKLGVFDFSGQELNSWLGNTSEIAFESTDEIICVFDCQMKVKDIITVLKKFIPNKKRYSVPYIYILLHKIDLLPENKRDLIIKNKIEMIHRSYGMSRFRIFGTSLLYFKKFQFIMEWMLSSMEMPLFNIDLGTNKKSVSESLLDTMRETGYMKEEYKDQEYVEIGSLRLSDETLDEGDNENSRKNRRRRKKISPNEEDDAEEAEFKNIGKFYIKEDEMHE
ncbi:MAG: hypothetical protein GY870_00520 [archaeon]|nr:hypothetical protein [archaeon]